MTNVLQSLLVNSRTLVLCIILIVSFSCRKNGEGGKSIIRGTVVHHTKAIPHATIYIKFKATEFPGTDSSLYHTHIKADGEGRYTFNCYPGEYYLYGTGVDHVGQPMYVAGGTPVRVRYKETKEIDVAVTEKH